MSHDNAAPFGPAAHFYECPRWHAGRWWASDMRGGTVYSFSGEGEARIELEIDDRPGGIGWTEADELLVVSMEAKALLVREKGGRGIARRIELGHLPGGIVGFFNDMAVSPHGQVYIGFDAYPSDDDLGMIVLVEPSGDARIVAEKLAFPNGLVFTPDGATLVAAETMKPRLSAFMLQPDGSLGPRADWGLLEPKVDQRACREPALTGSGTSLDGCAMDAQGYVWAADVQSGCLRIAPGGAIVDAVLLPDGLRAFACALGGSDGRTLMICGADDNFADRTSRKEARLFATRVAIGAAKGAGA